MTKERIIIITKECGGILLALGVTIILSRTFFSSASSPAINTRFIAQMGSKAQTIIAEAVNALSGLGTKTTAEKAGQGAAVSQDSTNKVVSVVFPKEFVYTLGSDGVYR